MTNKNFTQSVREAFVHAGFVFAGGAFSYKGKVAVVVLKVTRIPNADRQLIDVGFWLPEVAMGAPLRPEQTHMYFRLDRLFPNQKEVILEAGDAASPRQVKALAMLADEIAGEIAPSLIDLASSYAALRARFSNGTEVLGLITKEARVLLSAPKGPGR